MKSSDSFLMVIKDNKINSDNIDFLLNSVRNLFFNGYKNIFLDMNNVESVDNSFLNFLEKSDKLVDLNLFNLNSNIMSVLFITKFDKFVKIYNAEIDAKEALKPIVKRNFSLVSTKKHNTFLF